MIVSLPFTHFDLLFSTARFALLISFCFVRLVRSLLLQIRHCADVLQIWERKPSSESISSDQIKQIPSKWRLPKAMWCFLFSSNSWRCSCPRIYLLWPFVRVSRPLSHARSWFAFGICVHTRPVDNPRTSWMHKRECFRNAWCRLELNFRLT